MPFNFAGKKYNDLDEFAPGMLDQPAANLSKVVAGAAPFPNGACRGFLCDTAGTLDVILVNGEAFAGLPVQPGYNRIMLAGVTAFHGPTNVVAVY